MNMKDTLPKLLIVDDETDMCWVLEKLLMKMGFDLRIAQTGDAALRLMKSTRFRIALLDVKLTDMDGLDLAQRIKSMDASVDIVMMSGYYYKDDVNIQRAVEEGLVSGFISKPFLHEEVFEKLRSLAPTAFQP
jgi:two-component system response regulator HydG